jgi:hypothetical protein
MCSPYVCVGAVARLVMPLKCQRLNLMSTVQTLVTCKNYTEV